MADKRITKTKRNIKNTVIKLLSNTQFEKITVSELCRIGEISRITFYTYYNDIYDLIDEMFSDYIEEAIEDYHKLQSKNNQLNEPMIGYNNMLECILNLYCNNLEFFSRATPQKNPYLYSTFFRHTFVNVDNYIKSHIAKIKPKYPSNQIASLLCSGLWGVINECYSSKKSQSIIRKNIKSIYQDILTSSIFIRS